MVTTTPTPAVRVRRPDDDAAYRDAVNVTGDGPPDKIPITIDLHVTLDELEALGLLQSEGRHADLPALVLSALRWYATTQGYFFPITWFRE